MVRKWEHNGVDGASLEGVWMRFKHRVDVFMGSGCICGGITMNS